MRNIETWAKVSFVVAFTSPVWFFAAFALGGRDDPTRYGWMVAVAGLAALAPIWLLAVAYSVIGATEARDRSRRNR